MCIFFPTTVSSYSIPLILVIGWRGSPRINDEPQHNVKGKIISIDYKKSKKIGDIDIVKFIVEIFLKEEKITNVEYTLILPR